MLLNISIMKKTEKGSKSKQCLKLKTLKVRECNSRKYLSARTYPKEILEISRVQYYRT